MEAQGFHTSPEMDKLEEVYIEYCNGLDFKWGKIRKIT